MMSDETIRKLIDGLERAAEAQDLLETVWDELGPYHKDLSEDTKRKLEKYFSFDDSE